MLKDSSEFEKSEIKCDEGSDPIIFKFDLYVIYKREDHQEPINDFRIQPNQFGMRSRSKVCVASFVLACFFSPISISIILWSTRM